MKHRSRGFVLIVALVILFAVVSLVLALGRAARTDALASANTLAALQAASVARGAEQFVLALLTDERDTYDLTDASIFTQVPVEGGGFFWVVRPDYNDAALPQFGLVDESSKIDLNTIGYQRLVLLPGVTEDMAASVIDWRDADDAPTQTRGAESSDYAALANGYNAKNAAFESVDELCFVRGFTRDLLRGPPAGVTLAGSALGAERYQSSGLFDDFTVWSRPAQTTGGPGPINGRININTAPREVLRTLTTVISETDIETLLTKRALNASSDARTTMWVRTALPEKAQLIAPLITGQGAFYSADIVAVSGDGRAFKRVRIVLDTTATPYKIVYRRDLSAGGFPLDPAILQNLRGGGTGAAAGPAGVPR